jgi:hypothetical protein
MGFVTLSPCLCAAQGGRWPTPESTLHLWSWRGAILAQRLLRHKSRKRWFKTVFWGTVLVWLHTRQGGAILAGLLGGDRIGLSMPAAPWPSA